MLWLGYRSLPYKGVGGGWLRGVGSGSVRVHVSQSPWGNVGIVD